MKNSNGKSLLKPYVVKPTVRKMPKNNMTDVHLTANDLDFIVKAKAMCDMHQNDADCFPGADCVDCKWCAGVQMLDEFDPLARARLIDAADQKRWDIEDRIEKEEKAEKKIKAKGRRQIILGVICAVSVILPFLLIPVLEDSGTGPWPIYVGFFIGGVCCCIACC